MERTSEQVEKLGELANLNWTDIERKKMDKAFTLLDEVFYELQITQQTDKVKALWKARYELHEVVTAAGISKMLKDVGLLDK